MNTDPGELEHFLLELEPDGLGWSDLQELTAAARRAACDASAAGDEVQFLRMIQVPEQGACFLLWQAAGATAVEAAARRAGLRTVSVTQVRRSTPVVHRGQGREEEGR